MFCTFWFINYINSLSILSRYGCITLNLLPTFEKIFPPLSSSAGVKNSRLICARSYWLTNRICAYFLRLAISILWMDFWESIIIVDYVFCVLVWLMISMSISSGFVKQRCCFLSFWLYFLTREQKRPIFTCCIPYIMPFKVLVKSWCLRFIK